MWTKHFIFPAFLIALAAPLAVAQTPAKNVPTPAVNEAVKPAPTAETQAPSNDPSLPKANAPTPVLSFLEWKAQRVHEAQQKLEQVNKATNPAVNWQEGKSATDPKSNEQKLNFNVDVALQLNIQDYFSMYLKTLMPEDFKEATKKLTPDEVSELLTAYKNSLEKPNKIPLKFTKSAKDNAKSKNTEI